MDMFVITHVGVQVAKLDKASFLAELRGIGANKGKGAALPAGTGPATGAPPQQPQPQKGASGWGVLSDSFGLQGRFAPSMLCFIHACPALHESLAV